MENRPKDPISFLSQFFGSLVEEVRLLQMYMILDTLYKSGKSIKSWLILSLYIYGDTYYIRQYELFRFGEIMTLES